MAFYHRFVQEQLNEQGALVDFPLVAPEHFNFGYDVVDALAQEAPEKRALVWCNARHEERFFNFQELSRLSTQAANVFASYGIRKGDRVMLLLKRHYEYWYALVGLHKLGAVAIPATNLLLSLIHIYYRAKLEPEEEHGAREPVQKLSRLAQLRAKLDRFSDSMFSQAASTDEDTEMAEKYIPGTDEEVSAEPPKKVKMCIRDR